MKNVTERLIRSVAEIQQRDRRLSEELKDLREKVRRVPPREILAPEAMALEPLEVHPDFAVETIVLRTARPVLAIRRDEAVLAFSAEDSVTWKQRLENARPYLVQAIPAVGRVEVKHHPRYEWIGTGWLVADDVVVTNRHVAREFGRRSGAQFVYRQGIDGQRMEASIDFIEEFERLDSLEFRLDRILHIEDEDGPDIAFIRMLRNGSRLARKIDLAPTAVEEDEYVAVIGYPARDSRIPEQDLMRSIFGDHYDKKRLAPGQITGTGSNAVLHDCSTLGGNSGSVVLSLASGKAVGLHFAGRFLEANYAVPARAVAERLDQVTRGESPRRSSGADDTRVTRAPVSSRATVQSPAAAAAGRAVTCTIPIHVTVNVGAPVLGGGDATATSAARRLPADTDADEDDDLVITEARPEDYLDRPGYVPDFLGQGHEVPLPRVTTGLSDVLTFELEGETQQVLKYEHFAVLMSRSRRLCRFSAVNIDGKETKKVKRPAWRTDPRIPADAQIVKECYGNPPKFSRGHMTRREDPIWGPLTAARLGNADSMHVTNTVPQMQPFNAGIWLGLEDYALEHAREDDMRISVFTGPFLRSDDPVMFGVKIPRTFWKVIAFIHDDTGALSATGYRMSQEDFLREEEFVFGQHETSQVSIASIERETGLSFGPLADVDPFQDIEEARPAPLTDFAQIRFVR
jgi:DNA/RNA endonuclease G (NUC1)